MVAVLASRPRPRTSLLRQSVWEAPQDAELGVNPEAENLGHQFTGLWGAEGSIPLTLGLLAPLEFTHGS